MITGNIIRTGVAVMGFAACMSVGISAQTTIRVEESTASINQRQDDSTIEIQMPKDDASSITVTTTSDVAPVEEPASESTESIDLTPAEFKPVQSETPAAGGTATKDSQPQPDSDASNSFSVPTAAVATQSEETGKVDEADYLPSANLGKESVIMRGGERIPLRPELLSSVTLAITVPDVYATTLTNGIRFYHYESHDLPRVRVSLLIEAGKNADTAGKVGLAEITARTMRSGGAAGKSGDEIDLMLEQIGSDLELKVDQDHVAGSLFALSDKADTAMALLADILIRPDFNPKKFEQQKARAFEELRRQNDQPDQISRREFRKILYGADHPLARTPTSATISAITLDDVREFHAARYRPSTVWIGVSGDINRENARKLVEKAFGSWKRPEAAEIVVAEVDQNADAAGGVFLTRKATAQSQIRMGHFGMPRRSPDAYAVNVLNSIYGTGGFSSRLMNNVRTKHGYVYGVGGGVFSDDPVGMFAAVAASKAGTTVAAIREILNVTKGIIEGPITEKEVETARRDIVFTFVNQFDTPQETVATHMLYDYRGYAPDYLKNFPEHVRAVTVEDVKSVAKKYIHPDRIKIYVIGNPEDMDAPLDEFGDVQKWALEDYAK